MNDDLTELHAEAIEGTLGDPGRLISLSKSGYRERHPGHFVVFNGNVCMEAGKIWWGDLDLTLDEGKLVDLAARLGETLYIVYERDGRFRNEDDPLLSQALYSVTASGHTRFDHRFVERVVDGTLRRRPSPPDRRERLVLTLARPRLLRASRRERVDRLYSTPDGEEHTTLLYIGERSGRTSPLLVLGAFRRRRPQFWLGLELTWYPTPKRHAPRTLTAVRLRRRHGRTRTYLGLRLHPGLEYELLVGLELGR